MKVVAFPLTQAQPVRPGGSFDYVAIDAQRRRVYAAHGGGGGLMIAGCRHRQRARHRQGRADGRRCRRSRNRSRITGNGRGRSVSEVDPMAQTILRTVAVDGAVDAIAYDSGVGRIYADEDDGTRLFVIDSKTFKQIATVNLPGHKPEYLQIDPETHDVYQNISSDDPAVSRIVVIDATSLRVVRSIPTPSLASNHPLQYDADDHALFVAGENRVLAVYDRAGNLLHKVNLSGARRSVQLGALAEMASLRRRRHHPLLVRRKLRSEAPWDVADRARRAYHRHRSEHRHDLDGLERPRERIGLDSGIYVQALRAR